MLLEKIIKEQSKTQTNIDILDKKMDLSFSNLRIGQENIERSLSSKLNNVSNAAVTSSFNSLILYGLIVVDSGLTVGALFQFGFFSGFDSSFVASFKGLKQSHSEDAKILVDYLVSIKSNTATTLDELTSLNKGSNEFFKEFVDLRKQIQLDKYNTGLQNLKNNNYSDLECFRHEALKR